MREDRYRPRIPPQRCHPLVHGHRVPALPSLPEETAVTKDNISSSQNRFLSKDQQGGGIYLSRIGLGRR